MTGQTIILATRAHRQRAHALIDAAPERAVVNVAAPRRTNDQNALLWALLSEISRAKPQGRRHTPDDWKAIFMNACGWECQFIEGLDGRPFPQGFKSSRLNKDQMSNLLEYVKVFCVENGVETTNAL